MTKLTEIDVCIATFKRPEMLSNLLVSLAEQDLAGIAMRIIVVDNDRAQSGRAVVESFRESCTCEIVYAVEPEQNIALARNRAIFHVRSEYFAFIDDDESVSPRWLRSLLNSLIKFDADVAFGPVVSALPRTAPSWARACFRRPLHRKTGELMQYGGAGNVMLKRRVIDKKRARFNASFGLTGGEDTEFFYRLHLAGRRLIWCDEALATEPVPETRLTLEWIRRRGFRSGQTYNRIFVSRYPSYKKIMWFVTKSAQIMSGVVAAPVLRMISYPKYVALTVRLAGATGQLSCCFLEDHFEEYNARNYQ